MMTTWQVKKGVSKLNNEWGKETQLKLKILGKHMSAMKMANK